MWCVPKKNLILRKFTEQKYLSKEKIITELKKSKNICYFCGGKYDKLRVSINGLKVEPSCDLCYKIRNLNNLMIKEFVLCRSELKQYEIVRNFIDYYKKFNKHPSILDIDKTAKNIDISLLEYLNNPFKTNLKIYPTEYFDTSFLKNEQLNLFTNNDSNCIELSDSDDLIDDYMDFDTFQFYKNLQKNDPFENIPKSNLTKEEKKFLNYSFSIDKQIADDTIKKLLKISDKDINKCMKIDNDFYNFKFQS